MGQETQKRRAARNQALFREVNERIECFASESPIESICECCDTECTETMMLKRGEYEAIRQHPARFPVKPGHEVYDVERVVEHYERYLVVEKIADGRELAEALDPRTHPYDHRY